MFSTKYFDELQKSITSIKSKSIEYKVKQEIFTSLPSLNQQEKETFNKIDVEVGMRKDRLRAFYDYVKKRYPNFIELSFINEEFFKELYEYEFLTADLIPSLILHDNEATKFTTDLFLNSFSNEHSSFISYYKNNNKKEVPNKIDSEDNKITEQVKDLKNNVSFDINDFDLKLKKIFSDSNLRNFTFPKSWANFIVNRDLVLNEKTSISTKFDTRLNYNSLNIEINFFYSGIEKDLFAFLISKSTITHINIDFKSFENFDLFSKQTETLSREDFEAKSNKILGVILSMMYTYFKRNLNFLVINFSCSNQIFNLNQESIDNKTEELYSPIKLTKETYQVLESLIQANHLVCLILKNISLVDHYKEISQIFFNSLSLEILLVEYFEDIISNLGEIILLQNNNFSDEVSLVYTIDQVLESLKINYNIISSNLGDKLKVVASFYKELRLNGLISKIQEENRVGQKLIKQLSQKTNFKIVKLGFNLQFSS